MSEAAGHLARLDRSIARHGETVTVQRMQLVGGVQSVASSASCGAIVRDYRPEELVDGIIQGDSLVILSPTPLSAASFPGTVPRKGDRVVAQTRARTVQAATPFYVGATLVRIELQVRG